MFVARAVALNLRKVVVQMFVVKEFAVVKKKAQHNNWCIELD